MSQVTICNMCGRMIEPESENEDVQTLHITFSYTGTEAYKTFKTLKDSGVAKLDFHIGCFTDNRDELMGMLTREITF